MTSVELSQPGGGAPFPGTAKLCAQLRARRMPILSFKRASVALLATLSVFAFQSTAQADFTSITGTRAVTLATDGDCTPNNFTRFNIDVQLDSTGGDRIYLIDGNNLIIDTVNIGSGPLDISGLGIVTSNTPGAAPFAIVFSNAQTYTAGATYVADGDEVERTTFDPSLLDSDCPSPAPEIEISGNGQVILDRTSAAQLADHSQFENTDVGSTSTRTYTIRNLGSADLTVGASLQSGVVFSITGAPTSPVAPGGSTTVTVQFAPTFEVTTGDTLIITSNDGNEAETRFPIAGTGTNGTPNFEVRNAGGSTTIAHNDMAPRVADGTDFGGVDVTAGTESNTFNVQPAGSSAPALFTGAPSRVQITGTHAGDFSVTQDLPASQSGGAVLFTIQFDPSGPGLRQATVEIPSNVTGKNPYTFAIQGTGTGVTTGDVTFEVSIGGGDATLNLASPTSALAVAITTVNGQATRNIANVASGTHTVTLPDLTALGFGWTSISCADGDSTVDLAALTMTLELGVGESLVCTLQLVETRLATSRMIADFLGARNTQILANQPGFSRRWRRLNGGGDAPSSLTASVLGFSHTFAFPFQVAVSENAFSYAATLSGLTGNAAARSGDIGSWDVWSEGRLSRFDDSTSDNGLFAIVHGGADYRFSENLLLGLSVSVDWTEQDNATNSGHVSGTGWMAGPYATLKLDERVFVDLRAAWGQSSNQISPFGTYTDNFDTTRWLIAGSVGGDYAYGSWTLNPIVSVQYLSERQEAYVDSLSVAIPSQTVAQGDVRFEPRLSYLHRFDDGTRLRPWVRVSGVYTFGDGGNASIGSLARAFDGLTASVQTGLEMHAAGGASLAFSGQMDGFGANDAQSYGATVSVSVPLN
jgi:hypothetical protein